MANEILILKTTLLDSGWVNYEVYFFTPITPPIHFQEDVAEPKVTPAYATQDMLPSSVFDATVTGYINAAEPTLLAAVDAGDVLLWHKPFTLHRTLSDADALAKARSVYESEGANRIEAIRIKYKRFGLMLNA